MNDSHQDKKQFLSTFSIFRNGLKGTCPRCRQTSMFRHPIKLKPACENCGLDYSFTSPADGPSFFAMTLVSIVASAWTIYLRLKFDAPILVHLVTTGPFMLLGTVALLHYFRSWFVGAEYYIKVKDGRILHLPPSD